MNRLPELSRRQLEESGEILWEKEGVQGQSDSDENQVTEWDSLKDVPFRGDALQAEESENEAEEMSM